MLALFLLLGCRSPHDGDAPFSLSQGVLDPPFAPDVLHYVVAERELVDERTIVASTDSDGSLEQRTIDGAVLKAAEGWFDIALAAGQYVLVSDGDVTYQVTVVPSSLGEMQADGVASAGAILVATSMYPDPIDGLRPHLLIVDERGVPIWYRETVQPALDFHATADGRLTYIDDPDDTGWRGIVLGADYAEERSVRSHVAADGSFVETDVHLFDFQGDDAIVSGCASRHVDMAPWGAAEDCCEIEDYVVQQIAPDDSVVFEWNTKDHLDFSGLADARFEHVADGWEYAHINSWDLDVNDDTWLLSNLWTSQVLRIAPRAMTWNGAKHAAGDILERIGGTALSDYTFENDHRIDGQEGWLSQHAARAVGDDHLLLYDNGYRLDLEETLDSRAVEYALDREAGTATLVWSTTAKGSGSTIYGGAVQRLPNGGTLVGWGGLPSGGSWEPSATELDAEGNIVFTLSLQSGHVVSYRAAKAVLVDGRWTEP